MKLVQMVFSFVGAGALCTVSTEDGPFSRSLLMLVTRTLLQIAANIFVSKQQEWSASGVASHSCSAITNMNTIYSYLPMLL